MRTLLLLMIEFDQATMIDFIGCVRIFCIESGYVEHVNTFNFLRKKNFTEKKLFPYFLFLSMKLGKGEVNLSKTEDDEERKIHNCLLCGGKEFVQINSTDRRPSLLCQHAGFWGVLLRGVWQRFGHCSKMLNNPSCRSFGGRP
ncbi:hypothetical protein T4B_7579 [Trichinella pseudospiralis]|uniref:Uncharacterized protein n=1 Tax=Trichinella pseudospiralis TaxID=6337 RepID=A0A0V1ICR5_TRIPS|nr:hypothetical protein T4B_7579 [Trichinella pseudospiralis]